MGYKVLYRKYRPDNFDNVVGQDYTVEMLKNAINTGKNAHAYIFTGPRGTGKTSSAKIFAKALNCEHPVNGNPCNECDSCLNFKNNPDIIEIDAASNNGVDEIRELINNVKLVPTASKYKVYIIDEVHMLTASAFNALLLTLEEPPSHVVFILATTDIQDVPITILSRCQRFDFKPINKQAIVDRLKYVCSEESIKITDDALEEIALISAGGMRDALGMLDQLSNDDVEITLDMVSNYFGSVSPKKIDELLTSISDNNTDLLLEILGNIRDSGTNYSVFVEKLIEKLRSIAIDIKSGKCKYRFYYDDVYHMIFDLNDCLSNININIDPYVLIEIVLMKYLNTGNNSGENVVVLGNNSESKAVLGNNSIEVVGNKVVPSLGNNSEEPIVKKKTTRKKKSESNQQPLFDVEVRINNTFVNASKEFKSKLADSWVDFMNFLMSKEYYGDYSGSSYRFAALKSDLWKDSVEKYRLNLQNKIKYKYMEENISNPEEKSDEPSSNDIEDVAKDIFGTYEVE